jgi:uncharacterized membrane protein (DUF485 family)
MDHVTVEQIKKNPKFQQLVKTRSAFAWKLAIAMLVVYYAFILTIAFSPATLGASMGGIITVGIPVGVGIILFAFILTGVYVKRANTEFDALTQAIKEEAGKA